MAPLTDFQHTAQELFTTYFHTENRKHPRTIFCAIHASSEEEFRNLVIARYGDCAPRKISISKGFLRTGHPCTQLLSDVMLDFLDRQSSSVTNYGNSLLDFSIESDR